MLNDFESLKLKINYLQNLVDTKQKDIADLKNAFAYNVKYYNELVEKQKTLLASLRNNSMATYLNNELDLANTIQAINESLLVSAAVDAGNETSVVQQQQQQQHVDFSKSIKYLPHAVGGSSQQQQQQLLQPKFMVTKNRHAELVIGVPTIKREKTSYLLETLKSILDAMNELEKTESLVVIIIAEVRFYIILHRQWFTL
jgi:alpha-1,3-mannosylglycoprotein beta-1,4-N-acetylglucosaminyltransferase A/B